MDLFWSSFQKAGHEAISRLSESRLVIAEKKEGENGIGEMEFLWLIPKAVKGGSCSRSSAGHAESCGHTAVALLIET